MAADASAPFDVSGEGELVLVEETGAQRAELEAFVASRFREVYGARLYTFLPHLYGATDASGRLAAAFGLRRASEGPLFLERYLDLPIEQVILTHSGENVSRDAIAEVGNLAGATPGALRALIVRITTLLQDIGVQWVAFTGSARVCNGFSRLGLPLRVVAPAALDRLPESERDCWGTYYAHGPSVMIGDVRAGARLAAKPDALRARLAPLSRVGVP
jgi:hypothetical protein